MLDLFQEREFREFHSKVRNFTLTDEYRLRNIYRLLDESLVVAGDVVEFGSYYGGVAIFMGLILESRESSKKVHIFDSFCGLPKPEPSQDKLYYEGRFSSELILTKQLIREAGLEERIVIHAGWFKDSFRKTSADMSFCFAHIDANLYQSTLEALHFLIPRIYLKACVVVDDVFDGEMTPTGVERAILETIPSEETLFLGPYGQVYFRNRLKDDEKQSYLKLGNMWLSTIELNKDSKYIESIEKSIKIAKKLLTVAKLNENK